MVKIALLTDIEYEVQPNSLHGAAVFAYELASALHQSAMETGGITVDLVARKNSAAVAPLVSVDTGSLLQAGNDPLNRYAYQDTIYMQLVLAGAFDEYAIIHCVAPVVSPLILLAMKGKAIVQTITTGERHPAVVLPKLFLEKNIRQVQVGPYLLNDSAARIPPSVDICQFVPVDNPADDFLLWLGNDVGEEATAKTLAQGLNLVFKPFSTTDALTQLQHARIVLQLNDELSPCDDLWLIRALACGTPVAAWSNDRLQAVFVQPGLAAFAEKNDAAALIKNISALPNRKNAAAMRREYALAMFSRRSAVARYREIYKMLLKNT